MTIPAGDTTSSQSMANLSQRAQMAAGQPISELMKMALARPNLISLAAGFVDQQTLPSEVVRQAMEAMLASDADAQAALQYGTTVGYPPLRRAILDRLAQQDGPSQPTLDL